MHVQNEIIEAVYSELVNYACKNCECARVYIYDEGVIFSKKLDEYLNLNKVDVLSLLKEIKIGIKNNIHYQKICEIIAEKEKNNNSEDMVKIYLESILHKRGVNEFYRKNSDIIINLRKKSKNNTNYFIIDVKLTLKFKNELLKKKSLFDWNFKNGVQDLNFLSNDEYWLQSDSHEKICLIHVKDYAEQKKLEKIGIIFDDEIYKYLSV